MVVGTCLVALTGCVPIALNDTGASPDATFSPPAAIRDAAEQSRDQLSYTIRLPSGWHDLTDDYLAAVPTSVLSGYWTMADDLSTDGPYVTMSLFPMGEQVVSSTLSENAATKWESQLGDPKRGDSGYAETAAGGVITWASVSGDLDGERRTEHVAHILYGPYYMYVEVDTPEGDEHDAHALIDALQTVTISGPAELGDRAGAPVDADGTWASYCASLTAAAQADWQYVFQYRYDATGWDCPEVSDYLGSWFVTTKQSSYAVSVRREADMSLDDRLAELGTPEAVGDTGMSADGYSTELLGAKSFEGPNGSAGKRVDVGTTAPGSTVSYISRLYAYEDDQGGVVEVFVYDTVDNVVPETDWLEPFIATFTTASAS
jgi:hypothetical protein